LSFYVFDSSALAKRYMPEVGSAWVASITKRSAKHKIFVAQITPVEIVSAAMRRMHSGGLDLQTAKVIRLLVDRHYLRDYAEIRITNTLRERAEDLLENHQLRAADAIQLASALDAHYRLRLIGLPAPIFVCADQRLLAAAIAEGLQTDDPNLHP